MAYLLNEMPHAGLVHMGRNASKQEYLLNIHYPPEHLLRRPIVETQEMALHQISGLP